MSSKKAIYIRLAAIVVSGTLIAGISAAAVRAASYTQEKSLGGFSKYIENYYGMVDESEEETDTIELLADRITVSENIAFADVSEKLNIRKGPGTDHEIVGYIPSKGYCYVLSEEDDWALIQSGGIEGYVSSEYLVQGQDAVLMAKEVGTLIADVVADYVNLRNEPSTESEDNIIAVATHGMELEVLEEFVVNKVDEEAALWAKVRYEEEIAYIAKSFVEISYKFAPAKKVDPPAQITTLDNSEDGTQEQNSGATSSVRSAIAAEAQRYVGLRYVYGGNSLSSGADCSGFVLAVYRASGVSTSNIPRSSRDLAASNQGTTITRSQIRPGDMVFYGNGGVVSHMAVYIGNGKVANMSSVGMKMRIDSIDYRPIMKIKNYLG